MQFQFESAGPTLRIISLLFLFAFVLAAVAVLAGLAALPGWIAAKRRHRQAAAINICGWFGLPTGILWVLAIVWAYHRPSTDGDSALSIDSSGDPSGDQGAFDAATLMTQLDQLENAIARLEAASTGAKS